MLGWNSIMQQDNDPKAAKQQICNRMAEKEKSPDLNPSEMLWLDLKELNQHCKEEMTKILPEQCEKHIIM